MSVSAVYWNCPFYIPENTHAETDYHNLLPLRRFFSRLRTKRRPASPNDHCRGDDNRSGRRLVLRRKAGTEPHLPARRGCIPSMLSKSRFNRRLHQIPEVLWQALFHLLSELHQQNNPSGEYIIDSCPVPVCDNIRFAALASIAGRSIEEVVRASGTTSTD